MKKIYLLLLFCILGVIRSQATVYYAVTAGGDVTDTTIWATTFPAGSIHPHPSDFLGAGNTWIIYIPVRINSGETWNIAGNVIMARAAGPGVGTQRFLKTGSSPSLINIIGNLTLADTSFFTTAFVSTGVLTINLRGNLTVSGHSYFSTSGSGYIHLHFSDVGGTLGNIATAKSINWSSDTASIYTSLTFDKRCYRKLATNLPVPRFPDITDSLNGALDCLTYNMNAGNSAAFFIADSSFIYTKNVNGFDSMIQHMSATWYSPKANYYFNGTAPQITGLSFASTIDNSGGYNMEGNVTINNAAGVTLSAPTTFNNKSKLNLQNGTLSNGSNLIMNNSTVVNVDNGTLNAQPTYSPLVNIVYKNLGNNALAVTTGFELQPIASNSIGKLIVSKAGAVITLGSAVTVNDSLIFNAGIFDVSPSNYTINAYGNWANFASHTAFVPRSGNVNLAGITPIVLGGTFSTNFNDLTLNNTGGATIGFNDTVNGQLTLTAGNMNLNADTLVLGYSSPAIAPGTFSATNMIVASTAGEVVKLLNADVNYLFPIGDNVNYSPITLGFNGSGYGAGSYAGVRVTKVKHPNNANITNYLKRYWSLDMQGFTSPNYAVTVQYVPGDVVGIESKLVMGQWTGSWTKFDYANTTTHTLSTAVDVSVGIPPNHYTGLDSTKPTIVSSVDTIICQPGGTYTLNATLPTGDPGFTYTWAPSTGLSGTTGTSVIATPGITTTYTVTITDSNGFSGTAHTTVTVNAAPTLAGGISNNSVLSSLCKGDSLILFGIAPTNVANFAWSGPVALTTGVNSDTATVGSATPAASGVYTLTISNGPGANCMATFTTTATVNPLPLATTALGSGTYCDSAVISATNSDPLPHIIFFQGYAHNGTFTSLGSSPQVVYTSGTYYFRTVSSAGCWGPDDSAVVVINYHPTDYPFTPLANGGNFCTGDTGVHVIFSNSDVGVNYQLYIAGVADGAPKPGTGNPLDFGLKTVRGNYSITATNPTTTCSFHMSDSVFVNPIPLPTDQPLTGGGGYCADAPGVFIGLASCDPTDSYFLYHNWILIDSGYQGYPGSFNFGTGYYTTPGTYTVIAKNTVYGCIDTMSTRDSVWINPLPFVYHVSGGGTMCADGTGFNIYLDSSETGVSYQLFADLVAPIGPVAGTGSPMTFYGLIPAVPGANYTIVATSTPGCVSNMADSADIFVNPLPQIQTVVISGFPDYCVNDTMFSVISLGMSELNVNYQLYYNGVASGASVPGTGIPISFGSFSDVGTYKVTAVNSITGCTADMGNTVSINIHPLPIKYTVAGTGNFCNGGTGIDIILSNSETGTNYQLFDTTAYIGAPVNGTGALIDYGNQVGGGNYYVVATSSWGCSDTMNGSSSITVLPLPTKYNVTGGGQSCFPGINQPIGLSGSDTGIKYQLSNTDTLYGAPISGTGSAISFGTFHNPGTYTISAIRTSTGCKDTMNGSATIIINPLPLIQTVGGGGIYCAGTPGAQDSLRGSEVGVYYQLYRDTFSVPVATISGTGSPVSFGYISLGGTYTAIATNATTGCVSNMVGGAVNVRNPLPTVYTIAGGGSYCIGGAGLHIYLDGSNTGIKYDLFRSGILVGTKPGTGFGLDFGAFTTAGTYNIVATNTTTGCTSNMASTVSISINSLPVVFNVSGGGTLCAGAPGYPINLSGSTTGIRYTLMRGGSVIVDSADGTGGLFTFGTYTTAGTYTVTARDIYTLCTNNMTGGATVVVNPLPRVDTLIGGGSFCTGDSGVILILDSSQTGINYQLYVGSMPIGGPRAGTGLPINFGYQNVVGTYKINALNLPTTCHDTMYGRSVITENPLPHTYNVTGGGSYCISDSGVHIFLDGSDTGVNYQLVHSGLLLGSPLSGNTGSLDFGLDTSAGSYIVLAHNGNTGCHDTMTGSATIVIQNYAVPVFTISAYPGVQIPVGYVDTLVAKITGGGGPTPAFQWYINGNPVYGATNDTFYTSVYFNNDSITCDVTSSGACGGVVTTKLIVIRLQPDAVKPVTAAGSDIILVPNPNKGVFSLKGKLGSINNQDVTIEVTDVLGQVVYKNKLQAKNGVVDEQVQLSGNLANGMYLLTLQSGSEHSVFHFVLAQ